MKDDDMEQTSMRVTKRTTRHLGYLQSLFALRKSEKPSMDEIVWEALNKAYPDEMRLATEHKEEDEKQ